MKGKDLSGAVGCLRREVEMGDMTTEAQIQEHHDRQNEKLAKQIMALPDDVVISYDFDGKHYAYTAEYVKRLVDEWQSAYFWRCPDCEQRVHELHRTAWGCCDDCAKAYE